MSTKRKRPFINDRGELEVFWHQLPQSPNEAALNAITSTIGMDDSILDFIGEMGTQSDKTYWASFADAVASCFRYTDGSLVVPDSDSITELKQVADADPSPAVFFQNFAIEALVLRTDPGTKNLETPEELLRFVLDKFAPYDEFVGQYSVDSLNFAVRGLDVATDRQMDDAGEAVRTKLADQ